MARELVVSLSGGPRLLVAAIDAINHPPLLRVLARLRAGARQPTGTARWIPERRGATLSAMRLSAQLVGDPSTVLQLRFPLPRCEWTLGVFPDRIALTDLAGFVEMERTRALPCAVLLPPSVRDVLAEHLPGRAASA